MKMIKKILVGLCLVLSLTLSSVLIADLNTNTAHAADWCSEKSNGIIKCPTDSISFTQYSGKLISLDPAGYDPGIVQSTNVRDFVQKLVNWALSFLGFVSVILFIYAGFLYLSAAGESEKVDKSKKIMTYTVVGILIIMGSYAIVNTILNGPFSGGEEVYGEGQGYYVNGYNAPTEKITESAQALIEGYQSLYDSVSLLKAIQADTEKVNLTPPAQLTKTIKLQYLSAVKSRLRELKYNSVAFSTATKKINDLLSEIDKEIYKLQTTPDIAYDLQAAADQAMADAEAALDVFFGSSSAKSPITAMEGTDIFAILEDLTKDFTGSDLTVYASKLSEMKCSSLNKEGRPTGILGDHACVLKEVYDDVSKLDILEGTSVKEVYDNLNESVKGLASGVAAANGAQMDLTQANGALVALISAEDELVKELKDIKFVQTKLVADIVEGSAPLIVKFNVLNSQDPSGAPIDGTKITWDMLGTGDNTDCYSNGGKKPEDGFNNYCVYSKAGTYRAMVKITSSQSDKYAAGISAVDIRVYPPKVMVDLGYQIGSKETIPLSQYDDSISMTKTEGNSIRFTSNKSASSPQEIVSWKWDFGDGTPKEETKDTAHQYNGNGAYTVVFEAMAADGSTFRKIFTVHIGSPAARIDVKPGLTNVKVNDTLTFDGSGSSSDTGKITSYLWELTKNGGTNLLTENNTDKVFNYTFSESGEYTATLKVTDALSKVPVETTTKFTVVSLPPVPKFTYSIPNVNYPSKVYFDASDSYDPDGKHDQIRFEWIVKSKTETDSKTFDDEGSTTADATGQSNMNPKVIFNQIGEYDITLNTYSDGEKDKAGMLTTTSQTIKIDNVLDINWAPTQKTTDVLNDKGEAEMDFKFLSQNGKAYDISFGDGTSESGEINKEKSVPHIYKVAGKYDVRVTVYDENDNSNQIKKKIFIGGNEKPIAKITVYKNTEEVEDTGDYIEISRADQVTFDASASKNRDGTARNLKYFWDFGDKVESSKKSLVHNYSELSPKNPGYYKVTLRVVDINDAELDDSTEVKIKVLSLNPKFSSLQVIPKSGSKLVTPLYVNATAYGPVDRDGKITQYRWWYYDTKKPDDILGIQLTDTPNATLIIGTNGAEGEEKTYGFGLEITDNENNKFSSDVMDEDKMPTITAKNGANALPTAKFTVDRTKVFSGEPINFTSASVDPDGKIVKYIWDFEGDGFFNNDPTTLATMQKVFTKKNLNGIKVRLKVIDDKYGESISEAVTIYIDSNAKIPKAAFTAEVDEGKTVKFTNNSIADTAVGAKVESFKWDFDTSSQFKTADTDGDGKKDNDVNSTEENPEFTYDEYGVYQVKLTVTDSQGNENFVMNQVNVPPPASGAINSTSTSTSTTTSNTTTTTIGGTQTGTAGSLGTNPVMTTNTAKPTLKAVLITKPAVSADGLVKIPGSAGTVTFDFSRSTGSVSYYTFDKNIYIDTNKDGNPANEEDFKTYLPGEWTTNFDKAYGKTVVRLTVYDINGNKDSIVQEITFQ